MAQLVAFFAEIQSEQPLWDLLFELGTLNGKGMRPAVFWTERHRQTETDRASDYIYFADERAFLSSI